MPTPHTPLSTIAPAELGNVSKACKVMGLSRDTFYRYQNAVAEGGVDALFDSNRR
ncbi:helix-turn-helix domain-containing protein, partial [Burkholderia gladioli]|uniref:helix-turn-helix domain-containing protein n=1 Tax=Burkholderia gladioli TaxID=28095 RepID=UPI00163F774C